MTEMLQLHVKGGHNSLVLGAYCQLFKTFAVGERTWLLHAPSLSGNPPFIHVFLPWYTM